MKTDCLIYVLSILSAARLVPVVVLDDAAHTGALAGARVAGGLPVAEVTLRTPAAQDSIRVTSAPSATLGFRCPVTSASAPNTTRGSQNTPARPLTAVRLPLEELGRRAVRLLVEQLGGAPPRQELRQSQSRNWGPGAPRPPARRLPQGTH